MKRNNSYYILITTVIFIFIASCNNNSTIIDKNEQIKLLKTENDSLRKITVKLHPKDTIVNGGKMNTNYWYNEEHDGKSLKAIGISDPENFIKEALDENSQIIPLEAVLGGKMHFNNIQLLGSEWLIADFEDGHIQGKALYKYTISEKSEVKFELIESINHE